MKWVEVKIEWIPSEDYPGDRPQEAGKFSTPIRFEDDPDWGAADATWSAVLSDIHWVDDSDIGMAQMRFLSPDAPENRLVVGARFELFADPRCTVRGIITAQLDRTDDRPPFAPDS
jgi:hypothetical protein